MDIPKKSLFVLLVTISLALPVMGQGEVYHVVFQGLTIDSNSVDASEEINFETLLANYDEKPHTDYKVVAKIVDVNDGTLEYEETVRQDVDLAAREVIEVKSGMTVPSSISSGNYYLMLEAVPPTGSAFASVRKSIQIQNPSRDISASLGPNGMYLRIPRIEAGTGYVKEFDQISAGAQGEHIIPGTEFDIEFEVENDGSETIEPSGEINIVNTYSNDDGVIKELDLQINDLNPGESIVKTVSTSMVEPGTYKGNLMLEDDGKELIKSSVRIVIAGEAANIIRVQNAQDTYSSSEEFNLNSTFVGPADGTTNITDGYIKLNVIQDNRTVVEERKEIEKFPFNPKTVEFNSEMSTSLDDYLVRIETGKGEEVFDVWESRYQALEAERIITDSGTIKKRNACFDDGVCTPGEWENGCYDCREYDERPESAKLEDEETDEKEESENNIPKIILPLVAALILIAAVGLYISRKGKGGDNSIDGNNNY